jgi:serine/threonine-protein phosphatase 2A regulatory subunit B''
LGGKKPPKPFQHRGTPPLTHPYPQTPQFQEKYAVTVITRIFFQADKTHDGKLTARMLRKSGVVEAFTKVDLEEDINKVTEFFSYEHFYVLYCRFWELDSDRDYKISRDDLLKYGDHSLSHMIVDRIFEAAPRPFGNGKGKGGRDTMGYEDFIYFMLSEEDKQNPISVKYWFECLDVDGDGHLSTLDMRGFYGVQAHRMQCLGHEVVPFEDVLCQFFDMIKPKEQGRLCEGDFLQGHCNKVSGSLFDALFNLNKYLQFESRDPFLERNKREDEFDNDWDRYACVDYNRLAMEEEQREEERREGMDWEGADNDAMMEE